MRKATSDWRGSYENGDGNGKQRNGKHRGLTASTRQEQRRPARSIDQTERVSDNATRGTPTAHGAAPVLGVQRPTLDIHARCTTSGVPN